MGHFSDIAAFMRAATERATEAARAELNLATSRLNMQLIQAERAAEAARVETAQAWRKFDEERERLTAAAAACEKLTAEAEAARGDVERLREELAVERGQHPADCQPEGCGKCRRQREIEALREENARLRERLAGAERLLRGWSDETAALLQVPYPARLAETKAFLATPAVPALTLTDAIKWIKAEARDCGCSDRILAHLGLAAVTPKGEPRAATFVGVDPGGNERTVHRCTGCEWFINTTCMSEEQVTRAVHEHLRKDHTPAPCRGAFVRKGAWRGNGEWPCEKPAGHSGACGHAEAAPPAPAADVPRWPGFGTRRLSEPCSWCEAMPGDPCVPGNDFMPFHLHVNPPRPGSGWLRSASAAPTEEPPREPTCPHCGGIGMQDPRHSDAFCQMCDGSGKAPPTTGLASVAPTEEPPRNLRGPCACCGLTLPLHTSLAGDVCRNCALGQCTHKPTPPGGSSPGSDAPFDARAEAQGALDGFFASPNDRSISTGQLGERIADAIQRAYNRGLADRDAAVSRARAEQLAMALRRVDQSKPLRPLEHDTEYGKGWRHCYEQIRAQVASLSSTTETQTGGGK
jgi:hypothetical protein